MMSEEKENNKRIAKNTLYMYLRMFSLLLVGLYTSRIVINTLGISDYGIYNVMGGIIGMLTYVNTLLSGGTTRFLTTELGKGNSYNVRLTFSMANLLSIIAAIIILILGETVGLWFMSNKLNIDPARMDSALWVYQSALLSCCLSVLQTPYTASIIAHERMNIYAYMSIFDVIMKLVIVFCLQVGDIDKLTLYAVLIFSVNFLNFIIYRIICTRNFQECKMIFLFDSKRFREMMNYSGWNMLGAFSDVLNNYGLNILLNLFFGTTVNAARGIAMQVGGYVKQFYSNFQISSRPQVIKYYAQGNITGMINLINNTSKYCGYLLLLIIIPLFFNIEGMLELWLGHTPEYSVWFIRIVMLQLLFQSIDYPIGMGIHAVGKMKLPNLTSSILYLSIFPITYIILKLGADPILGYSVYLCISPLILACDMFILRKYIGFSVKQFVFTAVYPIVKIAFISTIFAIAINLLLPETSVIITIFKLMLDFVFIAVVVAKLGTSKEIQVKIIGIIKNKLGIR